MKICHNREGFTRVPDLCHRCWLLLLIILIAQGFWPIPRAHAGPTVISSFSLSNSVVRLLIASNDIGTALVFRGNTIATITNIVVSKPIDAFGRELLTTNVPGQPQQFYRAELRDGVANDSDSDGISDFNELRYRLFLNPTNAADAALDANTNGISNLAEFQQGRSPIFPRPQRQALSGGARHVTAINTNGIIFTWGQNHVGQFGNAAPNIPSFVYDDGCWNNTFYLNPWLGPLPTTAFTNRWLTLAAGDYHTLAIATNGALWAWGDYSFGQMGITNGLFQVTNAGVPSRFYDAPLRVGTNNDWRAVFASNYRSYGIRTNGSLWAWGYNALGVLGLPTNITFTPVPILISNQSNWVHVSSWGYNSSSGFAVGIQTDGSLWAWGQTALPGYVRDSLMLTNPASQPVIGPAAVRAPGVWLDVAVVGTVIYAIRADGTLWMVNDNLIGQAQLIKAYNAFVIQFLALGFTRAEVDQLYLTFNPAIPDVAGFQRRTNDAYLFEPASTRDGWYTVRGNQAGFIALNKDGTVWTTETGSERSGDAPRDGNWQRVNSDTDWRSIGAFVDGFAAEKANGKVWAWGPYSGFSEEDRVNGSVAITNEMVTIPGVALWVSAQKGSTHVAALDNFSRLWLWGVNSKGQLGLGDREPRLVPTLLTNSGPWVSYAVGTDYTVAVHSNKTMWAWGHYPLYGDARDYTAPGVVTPVQIAPGTQWSSVYASESHVLAFDVSGQVWIWGASINGLSTATTTNLYAVPTPVNNLPACSQISYGGNHGLAIATTGALYAFGNNASGQLGLGVANNSNYLATVVPGASWKWVCAGPSFSQGIKLDGSFWSWGGNFFILLGITNWYLTNIDGAWSCTVPLNPALVYPNVWYTGLATNSPARVGTDNNWRSSAGATFALKTDGTLWFWGRSPLGSVTNQPVRTPPTHPYPNIAYPTDTSWVPNPIRVGSRSDWAFINQDLAITTGGTIYMWGINPGGQLALQPCWWPAPVNTTNSYRNTPAP